MFRKKKEALPLTSPGAIQIFVQNQSKLLKPFAQHPAVYSAVQTKARNLGQVPLRLYKKTNLEKPDENTPLNQLFRGNRSYPGSMFFEGIVVQLDIYGQAFLFIDDETTTGGIPKSLLLAMSSEVEPIKQNNTLTGWQYNGIIYGLERTIQIKYYNPYDSINGLAPLTPMLLGVETDYNAMLYNNIYFANDGTPGNVFSTDQLFNDQTYNRLKEQIIGKHTGVNNAHKSMILEGGLKPASIRANNKDLEFMDGRKYTFDEVATVFGVPKEALQRYEDINYATATTANRSFWEKTLMPLGDMICDAINYLFLDSYGYEARFDYSTVSALSQPIAEKAGAAKVYYDMGVPFDKINQRFNLGFQEFEGWDIPFGGRTPSTGIIQEPIKTAKKTFVDKEKQIEALRKAAWIKLNDKVNPLIGKTAKSLRGYFRGVNQKLLKALTGAKNIKQITDDEVDSLVAGLLDDDKLKNVLGEHEKAALSIGATSIEGLSDFDIQTMLAIRLDKIKEINATTRKLLADKLHEVIAESAKQGLTEAERTRALIRAAEEIGEFNLKRARTIARTEMHGAFSEGRYAAAKETQPKYKKWIADVYSDKTRDSHRHMHGEKAPYGEAYSNGLMYPLDPSGDPSETINCRCVEVYEYEE